MNISELHTFVTQIALELPEKEAGQLIHLRDSLEELGPKEWSYKLELFANDMLLQNIGNYQKLGQLMDEAGNTGSIEIKPIYLLVIMFLVILVVYLA